MSIDEKDIWEYFLNKEKKIEDKKESETDDLENKNFFEKNLEKYLTSDFKKEDLDHNIKPKKNKKKAFKHKPRATIDLHGKTSKEALMLFENFIKRSYFNKITFVLVIVGKGIHSEDGRPIIKETIEDWIKKNGKKYISSYNNAPQRLGGSGAIFIILKKS
jgi:DNA-nicking Smr family endonuclease